MTLARPDAPALRTRVGAGGACGVRRRRLEASRWVVSLPPATVGKPWRGGEGSATTRSGDHAANRRHRQGAPQSSAVLQPFPGRPLAAGCALARGRGGCGPDPCGASGTVSAAGRCPGRGQRATDGGALDHPGPSLVGLGHGGAAAIAEAGQHPVSGLRALPFPAGGRRRVRRGRSPAHAEAGERCARGQAVAAQSRCPGRGRGREGAEPRAIRADRELPDPGGAALGHPDQRRRMAVVLPRRRFRRHHLFCRGPASAAGGPAGPARGARRYDFGRGGVPVLPSLLPPRCVPGRGPAEALAR